MKRNLNSIILFLIIGMMHFSCDDRKSEPAVSPYGTVKTLSLSENSTPPNYTLIVGNVVQTKIIKAEARDESSTRIPDVRVNYSVVSDHADHAVLSKPSDVTHPDSTVILNIDFTGYNSNEIEFVQLLVEASVEANPEIKDTIIFYEIPVQTLRLEEENQDYSIALVSTNQLKNIKAVPLGLDQGVLSNITVQYRVISDLGYIQPSIASSDSTALLTISLADYTIPEDNIIQVHVEGLVVARPFIKDTITFAYNEFADDPGGITVYVPQDTIPYLNEFGELLHYTPVYATLIDTSGNPAINEWVEFESIIDSTTGSNSFEWVPFGSMNPTMARTNENGTATSIFQSTSKTGFGRLVATALDNSILNATDTTILYVDSGEAISLEILPASPDNEIMVIGGGDQESAQIAVEVRDGNGNIVNQEYRVVFTIPCPYPIDGPFCPGGDGDFTNDLKINGIIVDPNNPTIPTDTVETVNGTATITLNSGNMPGSVQLRAELYSLEDNTYSNIIASAEEIPITIVTGPPSYGVVGYSFADADTIGGGLQVMPISCMLWDIWSNPVADCTNVWFSVVPAEAAVIIGEAQTGNQNPSTGNSYPGVAWTTMQWSSVQTFEFPEIYAQTHGIDQFGNDIELVISSEDNAIDYQNPCVQCNLQLIPLTPTMKDFCPDPTPLRVIFRGILTDAYNVPVSGGQIQMVIYDAIDFTFIDDPNQVPPAIASPTQISNDDGMVTWVVDFGTDNCYNTNPDDPDEFECATPLVNAFLFDPNGAASEDITVTLIRSCGDQ